MINNVYPMLADVQIPNLSDIYNEHFGFINNGVFVECGSFDGISFSNTYGLSQVGWRGLHIEPILSSYNSCLNNHKAFNTQCLNSAIGEFEGEIPISVGGVLSTTRSIMVELFSGFSWAANHHSNTWINVKQTTLNKALEKFNIPTNFELLVIDVEGAELAVLKGFTISKYQPKMVIIELHDINPNYSRMRQEHDEIKAYFEPGYQAIYKDQTNTIYLKKD